MSKDKSLKEIIEDTLFGKSIDQVEIDILKLVASEEELRELLAQYAHKMLTENWVYELSKAIRALIIKKLKGE